MGLRVRMLGGFEVCRDPGGPVEIPARKARALLALLARHPGQTLGREALAARLWPDASERNARTSLRQTLKQLRHLLGGGAPVILSEGDALVLNPASVEVDAVVFERLCGEGSLASLERAAGLYQGGILDGVVPRADGLEEWLTFERSALREMAVGALTRLAEAHSEVGWAEPAVHAALRLLALDPLQEHVHRLLMRLYLDQGRRGDAAAHQELSTACQWLGRIDEALAEVRIAVELNPFDAVGLHQLGNKSDLAGDSRGIGYMEQAHRLNPLDMQLHTRLAFLARAYLNAGDCEQAAERVRRAIRRRASYAPSHYILALALGGLGRIEEGRAALARCEALKPGSPPSGGAGRPTATPSAMRGCARGWARLEGG